MNRIMRVSHAVFTEDEDHVEAYLGPLEGPAANERHVRAQPLGGNSMILHSPSFLPSLQVPRWPVFVFTASAIFCLGCSATFHLFYVMNREAAVLFQRVDFAGIAVLIGARDRGTKGAWGLPLHTRPVLTHTHPFPLPWPRAQLGRPCPFCITGSTAP